MKMWRFKYLEYSINKHFKISSIIIITSTMHLSYSPFLFLDMFVTFSAVF